MIMDVRCPGMVAGLYEKRQYVVYGQEFEIPTIYGWSRIESITLSHDPMFLTDLDTQVLYDTSRYFKFLPKLSSHPMATHFIISTMKFWSRVWALRLEMV
jgi:hypothetical protein